jgi:hypothetical protein
VIKNYAPQSEVKARASKEEVFPRESELLTYVLDMRYLSLAQIKKRFELNEKAKPVLEKLVSEGRLKTKDKDWSESTLFVATPKAQEILQKENPDKKVPPAEKNIFQPRVNHDLLLNDLRIRFEDLGFISKWVSEKQMKEVSFLLRCFQDFPDALCKKKNDKSYFLELEVSEKGPKQYRERIDSYLDILKKEEIKDAGIEGVIFFCVKEEVVEKIKSQIPEGAKGISVLSYYNYFKPKKEESKVMLSQNENRQNYAIYA